MRRGAFVPPPEAPALADLFAALPVAVMVLDPAGRIVAANPDAETLLNLSERAMVGRGFADVVGLPAAAAARRDAGAIAAFDIEIDVRGKRLRVDMLEATVADRPGWRIVTLHHAASSRALGLSSEREAGARAAIGAAAMLAHEIKNPLSGIRGAAQLIAGGADHGDLTTLITTEVDRIAALIDRMQDFTDTRPLTLAAENIYPLLDHARRVALAGFARDLPIEEQFDPSLPPVLVDRDALLQVVLNLLKNAGEAMAGRVDGRIIVSTAYRHGVSLDAGPGRARRQLPIEICIADTGPGAPPEIEEHLFDPFVSGRPEGKGLGLALVDKLVRGMGGIIQYAREGDPARTVFRLRLARGTA